MKSSSRIWLLQIDGYLVVGDALVPPGQCPPCGLLDDCQLVIVPGDVADGVQAGEERDGGEHDLLVIIAAQQAGGAAAPGCPPMVLYLGFVMTLGVSRR